MENMTYQKASKFCGNLLKKSHSMFVGFQKRYFEVIEGRLIYFKDYKKLEAKGLINLSIPGISILKKDELNFDIVINNDYIDNQSFSIKAENETDFKEWIAVLEYLVDHYNKKRDKYKLENDDFSSSENDEKNLDKKLKFWKIKNVDKESYDILQKCCSNANADKDNQLSQQCLTLKGLTNVLNVIPKEKLDNRIQYGWLYKLGKGKTGYFQKRWVFMISSRALFTDQAYKDDTCLDFKLPERLEYDCIYYYRVDNELDRSDKLGTISLSNCHGLQFEDKDEKYSIHIDLGDRYYEFYAEIRAERDVWFECLKNSWKTTKDIKASISKLPRTITKLQFLLENEGMGVVKTICNDEIKVCHNMFRNISDIDDLSRVLDNLGQSLSRTLDGCLLVSPIPMEIFRTYVDLFNGKVIDIVKDYWEDYCKNIDTERFLQLAFILFNYKEKLVRFGINDLNIEMFIEELMYFVTKKGYFEQINYLGSILKMERAKRAVICADTNFLVTSTPIELIKITYNYLELLKSFTNKKLFESLLLVQKELVSQYFLAIDTYIERDDLDIDKEFIIALANNVWNLNTYMGVMIEDLLRIIYLSPEELKEGINIEKLKVLSTVLCNSALYRVASEIIFTLYMDFQKEFKRLEVSIILNEVTDVFKEISNYLLELNKPILWECVLKEFLLYYSKSLFENAKNMFKELNELTDKIKRDKSEIANTFKPYISSENLEKEMILFTYLVEFLDVSGDMVSFTCSKLREKIGPSFTNNNVKILVGLRFDLSDEEKKEAIAACKEILDNFQSESEGVEEEEKKIINIVGKENYLAKRYKQENEVEGEIKRKSIKEEGNGARKTVALKTLMNLGIDMDDMYVPEDTDTHEETTEIKMKAEVLTSETDIVKKGFLEKKTYAKWQKRYFTLKNGFLYWYKNETSTECQNFIDIRGIRRIESHKEKKFLILAGEKVYKFACKDDDEMNSWINIINSEIRRIKLENQKSFENIYDVKYKNKKLLRDLWNMPKIGDHMLLLKVNDELKSENYFKEKTNNKIDRSKLKIDKNVLKKVEKMEFKRLKIEIKATKTENFEIETIVRKQTKSSYFSCCNRLFMCFRRVNKYNDLSPENEKEKNDKSKK